MSRVVTDEIDFGDTRRNLMLADVEDLRDMEEQEI